MPIVLFRVDERLIHGQVVVGWGERLHPDRILVVDDELVASPWEQELYCLGVPPSMEAGFVSVATALQLFAAWQDDPRRSVLLARSLQAVQPLAEAGLLAGTEVNLGGLHHGGDREKVLPYLFLSPEERRLLHAMAEHGVAFTARDLPDARAFPLAELVPNA